jgi:hypothetical protein
VGLPLTVPKEGYEEVRGCQVIMNSAYRVIWDYTTHHGHPVGELIFLFERMAFWGEIVDLHFLGVNLSRLLALRRSPLGEKIKWGTGLRKKRRTRSWRGIAAFSGGIDML